MPRPMHVACVFGTRPEAIKMAPVIKRLRAAREFNTSVISTGQHREMLDQVLSFFCIEPDIRLSAMLPGQNLDQLTATLLNELQPAMRALAPDVVLVHGDTTTTFSAALSAFYSKIPVGHVEAGLRTNVMTSPWPEEANRRLTAVLTDFHFAPTQHARAALLSEGHRSERIWVTGNTVIDALFDAVRTIENSPEIGLRVAAALPNQMTGKRSILVTGHRRENFDGGLAELCDALLKLAARGDVEITFPIHLNPTVQDVVRRHLSHNHSIHLLPPLDYPTFVTAMRRADLILTDSGGVQEEAPSLGKPVLVMRDTTERPEAVDAGTVKVIGMDSRRIVEETNLLLDEPARYELMSTAHNPYGDGKASERIFDVLRQLAD